jgi:hypothetical protein
MALWSTWVTHPTLNQRRLQSKSVVDAQRTHHLPVPRGSTHLPTISVISLWPASLSLPSGPWRSHHARSVFKVQVMRARIAAVSRGAVLYPTLPRVTWLQLRRLCKPAPPTVNPARRTAFRSATLALLSASLTARMAARQCALWCMVWVVDWRLWCFWRCNHFTCSASMLGIEIDKYDGWLSSHLLTCAVAGLRRRRDPVHFACLRQPVRACCGLYFGAAPRACRSLLGTELHGVRGPDPPGLKSFFVVLGLAFDFKIEPPESIRCWIVSCAVPTTVVDPRRTSNSGGHWIEST